MSWTTETLLPELARASMQSLHPGEARDGITVASLAIRTGREHKEVSRCLDVLRRRGLAERLHGIPGRYRITDVGREAAANGARIRSGPCGPLTGRRAPRRGTLRERVWQALRQTRKASLPELLRLAATGGEKAAESNARRYLRLLESAGYVRRMARRAPGTAPTSPGFHRWVLVKDTGPRAPRPVQDGAAMWDPNLHELTYLAEVDG